MWMFSFDRKLRMLSSVFVSSYKSICIPANRYYELLERKKMIASRPIQERIYMIEVLIEIYHVWIRIPSFCQGELEDYIQLWNLSIPYCHNCQWLVLKIPPLFVTTCVNELTFRVGCEYLIVLCLWTLNSWTNQDMAENPIGRKGL